MSEIQIGSVLSGRYRIEAKLGEGGMAVVYRAYDVERRVAIAVKALKPDFAEDPVFLRRFRREARNLALLNHPNIVRFYELAEDSLAAFIVLDYIDGLTLRKVLRLRNGPLSPGEILGYLRPIAAALSYAHRGGFVHCDMKPANVMIDHYGRVFITDFGIARVTESATITFSTPGTPAYMAPEQWRGGDDVCPATDIYGMGIMLYEMLTGHQPFIGERVETKGHTRERLMQEHLHIAPLPPSQLNPQIPPALDRIILTCLAKRPDGRYQSVEALLTDLESACGGAQAEIPVPAPAVSELSPTSSLASSTAAGQILARPGAVKGGVPGGVVAIGGLTVLLVLCAVIAALRPLLNSSSSSSAGQAQAISTTTTSPSVMVPLGSAQPNALAVSVVQATNTDQPPAPTATRPPTATRRATNTPSNVPRVICDGTPPTRLHIGERVFISLEPPDPNRVRNLPGKSNVVLGKLYPGEEAEIIDGPVCADGWVWWKVRALNASDLVGWTAEGDFSNYWLIPLD